jgi:glycine/D-amino acid oxidase-like deaminating enzyme
VTVLEASVARAQSQPGHLAAALTPVVSRQDDHYARLSRAGSLRARVRWAQMADDSVTPCGALQLQRTSGRIVDLKTMADELNFPEQFLRFVDAAQASDLAGMALTRGGLYFATACRVQPLALLDRLAQTDGVTCLSAQVSCVERVEHGRGQWRVLDRAGVVLAEATQVVLAAGLATQALLAAKVGATFISPFIGRLDDVSQSGMELIHDIRTIYDNYGYTTAILAASIRHPIHILEAAKAGADVATMPPKILRQLYKHPLTDIGLENFLKDWKQSGLSI